MERGVGTRQSRDGSATVRIARSGVAVARFRRSAGVRLAQPVRHLLEGSLRSFSSKGDTMNRKSVIDTAALAIGLIALFSLPGAAERHESGDDRGERKSKAVEPKFGLTSRTDGPFPADRFTVKDKTQNTCERVNLPMPADCVANDGTIQTQGQHKSTCIETGLINQLDGFNTRPRISIPFDGEIDLRTVNRQTIFLVSLGDSMIGGAPGCLRARVESDDEESRPRPDAGWVVGIDQAVWDPETNTLHVEAAETLEQHTRYVVFVTRGVKDKTGEPIETPKAFKKAIGDDEDEDTRVDPAIASYEATLRRAVDQAHFFGVKRHDIAVASVFTTLSVTAAAEKIRAAAMATPAPSPASVAVFDLSRITKITHNREVKAGALTPANISGNLPSLRILDTDRNANRLPPAIKSIAFFRIQVPNYLQRAVDTVDDATCAWDETLQQCATLVPFATYAGTPKQFGTTDLYLELIVPSGTPPSGGWPVVVWGHERSFGAVAANGVRGFQLRVAAVFASQRIATVSWNQVGFGFGPASTVTVEQSDKPALTFPFPGRAYDVNHDGTYDATEGSVGFKETRILFDRDANRQGIADIAQIIRAIEVGVEVVDVDGVRVRLDPERVYYGGLSKGAVLGVLATAVEPRLKASALSSPNGFIEFQKVPAERGPYLGRMLQDHVPSLLNPPDTCALLNPPNTCVITQIGGVAVTEPFYNENMPEPGQQPIRNDIPGALEIQDYFERLEWLNANNAAGAFMEYLRSKPINVPINGKPRPVLIQVARGDRTTVNPSVAEGVRAADVRAAADRLLADRVTLFRYDLFPRPLPSPDPHTFLVATDVPSAKNLALQAQEQIAVFYNSNGKDTIDPDGPPTGPCPPGPDGTGTAPRGCLFETPAVIPPGFGFVFP